MVSMSRLMKGIVTIIAIFTMGIGAITVVNAEEGDSVESVINNNIASQKSEDRLSREASSKVEKLNDSERGRLRRSLEGKSGKLSKEEEAVLSTIKSKESVEKMKTAIIVLFIGTGLGLYFAFGVSDNRTVI